MNFEQKINDEIKAAMKSGDKIRIDVLRSLRAAIIEFNKSGSGKELDDDEAMKILTGQAKKRRDAIEMYEKGGREELAEKEKAELKIIGEFLPKQLGDAELTHAVKAKIAELGASDAKDMGKVIGALMKELKGKADGKAVQAKVRELLA